MCSNIYGSRNWVDAADSCKDEDGYLVRISSQDDNDFLFGLYDSAEPGKGFWAGFTDQDSEGTWVWEDGEAETYTNWNSRVDLLTRQMERPCLLVTPNEDWNDLFGDKSGRQDISVRLIRSRMIPT